MPKIQFDIENTIEIKKSKFITYLHRTSDEEEAKEYIRQIKEEFVFGGFNKMIQGDELVLEEPVWDF